MNIWKISDAPQRAVRAVGCFRRNDEPIPLGRARARGGSELLLSLCDAIAEQSKEGDNPLSKEQVFEAFRPAATL